MKPAYSNITNTMNTSLKPLFLAGLSNGKILSFSELSSIDSAYRNFTVSIFKMTFKVDFQHFYDTTPISQTLIEHTKGQLQWNDIVPSK